MSLSAEQGQLKKGHATRRLTSRGSQTAQWTCFVRAISFRDPRSSHRCEDWLARQMLTGYLRILSGPWLSPLARLFFPTGSYEQVIARTKYFDEALVKYSPGAQQVLIFGAGLDTRSIRLAKDLAKTTVFELDAPSTQAAKAALLARRKIAAPANVAFVPVDFETESLSNGLRDKGFTKGLRSIFLLEGLTMYLSPLSLERTFRAIQDLAGNGSMVLFDVIEASALRAPASRIRNAELFYASLAGEPYVLGMDPQAIEEFLGRYSLVAVDIASTPELEARYFTDRQGRRLGSIRGKHSTMVTARKI